MVAGIPIGYVIPMQYPNNPLSISEIVWLYIVYGGGGCLLNMWSHWSEYPREYVDNVKVQKVTGITVALYIAVNNCLFNMFVVCCDDISKCI